MKVEPASSASKRNLTSAGADRRRPGLELVGADVAARAQRADVLRIDHPGIAVEVSRGAARGRVAGIDQR
jgi:hypothetical protein